MIFLWIFVDQLYIQMGLKKNEAKLAAAAAMHADATVGPMMPSVVGSSALKRKNSNVMVIDHSTYASSYATLPRPGKVLGVGELERRQYHLGHLATPSARRPRSKAAVARTRSMSSQ